MYVCVQVNVSIMRVIACVCEYSILIYIYTFNKHKCTHNIPYLPSFHS